MPDQNHSTEVGNALQHSSLEQQQRRRMLIALGVLLIALMLVLIKDRQYWFPPSPSAESETPEQASSSSVPAKSVPQRTSPKATAPARIMRGQSQSRPRKLRVRWCQRVTGRP